MDRLEFFQMSFCRFREKYGVAERRTRGGMDKKHSDSAPIFGTERVRTRFVSGKSFADNQDGNILP